MMLLLCCCCRFLLVVVIHIFAAYFLAAPFSLAFWCLCAGAATFNNYFLYFIVPFPLCLFLIILRIVSFAVFRHTAFRSARQ